MTEGTAGTRPHRARRGEGDRLRGEVMDAAERLLIEHGSTDAVSMRAIAKAVGVTPPAIYLHFSDKDELFFAVCERRFNVFAQAMLAALAGAGSISPADQVEALGRRYIAWGLEHPEHYGVLFGSTPLPDRIDPLELQGRQVLTALIGLIEQGSQDGTFTISDPIDAAVMVWSGVHGFVELATSQQMFTPDLDIPSRGDQVVRQLLRALTG